MARLLNISWDPIWQCQELYLQLNVLIGLASAVALGHPTRFLFHCWHSRTGFEHRLSWFQSVKMGWIKGRYSVASYFCPTLGSYSFQKRGVDVRWVLSGLSNKGISRSYLQHQSKELIISSLRHVLDIVFYSFIADGIILSWKPALFSWDHHMLS